MISGCRVSSEKANRVIFVLLVETVLVRDEWIREGFLFELKEDVKLSRVYRATSQDSCLDEFCTGKKSVFWWG